VSIEGVPGTARQGAIYIPKPSSSGQPEKTSEDSLMPSYDGISTFLWTSPAGDGSPPAWDVYAP